MAWCLFVNNHRSRNLQFLKIKTAPKKIRPRCPSIKESCPFANSRRNTIVTAEKHPPASADSRGSLRVYRACVSTVLDTAGNTAFWLHQQRLEQRSRCIFRRLGAWCICFWQMVGTHYPVDATRWNFDNCPRNCLRLHSFAPEYFKHLFWHGVSTFAAAACSADFDTDHSD